MHPMCIKFIIFVGDTAKIEKSFGGIKTAD